MCAPAYCCHCERPKHGGLIEHPEGWGLCERPDCPGAFRDPRIWKLMHKAWREAGGAQAHDAP